MLFILNPLIPTSDLCPPPAQIFPRPIFSVFLAHSGVNDTQPLLIWGAQYPLFLADSLLFDGGRVEERPQFLGFFLLFF